MSEQKKEAREALLGELESIKNLLSEEEWEHIPLLDDPVTAPTPVVVPAAASAQTNSVDHEEEAGIEERSVDGGLDLLEEWDPLEPRNPAAEWQDAAAAPSFAETALHSAGGDLEAGAEVLDFDEHDIPVLDEVYLPPELAETPTESRTGTEPVTPLSYAASDTPLAAAEPEAAPAPDTPSALTEPTDELTELPPLTEASPPAAAIAEVEQTSTPLAEQSSPSPAEPTSPPPAEEPASLRPYTPTYELRPRMAGKRPAVEPRGENPFLPQHIRERLHTHKRLVDIIKETPVAAQSPAAPASARAEIATALPKVMPQEKLQQLIDGLVAVYLPRIEADLRAKLLEALQTDSDDREER